MKICNKCKETKPPGAFYKDRYSSCKKCEIKRVTEFKEIYRARWQVENPYELTKQKKCPRCRKIQPGENFARDAIRRDGLHQHCKTCDRNRKIKSKYGLNHDDAMALWSLQGGKCGLCNKSVRFPGKQSVIDHCHTEGHVRGILCQTCNKGLGMLGDTPERIRLVLNYLEGKLPWQRQRKR